MNFGKSKRCRSSTSTLVVPSPSSSTESHGLFILTQKSQERSQDPNPIHKAQTRTQHEPSTNPKQTSPVRMFESGTGTPDCPFRTRL